MCSLLPVIENRKLVAVLGQNYGHGVWRRNSGNLHQRAWDLAGERSVVFQGTHEGVLAPETRPDETFQHIIRESLQLGFQ